MHARTAIGPLGLGLVLMGCAASGSPGPTSKSTAPTASVSAPPSSSTSAAPTSSGHSSSPPSSGTLTAADATGVVLSVSFDRLEVAPGDTVTAHISIHNGRATPLVYEHTDCDGPVNMTVTVALPVEPSGRKWTGLAGTFKTYTLTKGYGPGGVPATDPVRLVVPDTNCGGDLGPSTLAPGETLTATMRWPANIVTGIPALPGDVPFTISWIYDPVAVPTPVPGQNMGGLPGPRTSNLTVAGRITIVGAPSKVLSAGQAIDFLLADPAFVKWLKRQPASSWETVDMFPESEPKADGFVPKGVSWSFQVFRHPRNFALAWVDAYTGAIISINYCDIPCNR
jgi:hypothetical protein